MGKYLRERGDPTCWTETFENNVEEQNKLLRNANSPVNLWSPGLCLTSKACYSTFGLQTLVFYNDLAKLKLMAYCMWQNMWLWGVLKQNFWFTFLVIIEPHPNIETVAERSDSLLLTKSMPCLPGCLKLHLMVVYILGFVMFCFSFQEGFVTSLVWSPCAEIWHLKTMIELKLFLLAWLFFPCFSACFSGACVWRGLQMPERDIDGKSCANFIRVTILVLLSKPELLFGLLPVFLKSNYH